MSCHQIETKIIHVLTKTTIGLKYLYHILQMKTMFKRHTVNMEWKNNQINCIDINSMIKRNFHNRF